MVYYLIVKHNPAFFTSCPVKEPAPMIRTLMQKPVLLLTALFLAAAFFAGCGEDLEHASTEELMQKGRTACETKDYRTAAKYFTPAAERGNAEAQYHVGLQLLYGADNIKRTGNINDVIRELNEMKARGAEWLRKSAEQGYAPAQYSLAGCYLNGTGMERDAAKGIEWLRKAAAQDEIHALYELANRYLDGRDGVEKDRDEAVELYRKAAEQGHVDAKHILKRLGVK